MRRLLRGTFKLALIAGVIGALVAAARKLMGGLGPEPGSADAPREWPSLVPEPDATPTPLVPDPDAMSPVPTAPANGQAAPVEAGAPVEDAPES